MYKKRHIKVKSIIRAYLKRIHNVNAHANVT